MKRLWLLMLVVVAPVAPSLEGVLPASTDRSAPSVWGYNMAFAQTSEIFRERRVRGHQGTRHGRGLERVPRELSDRFLRRSGARVSQEARRGRTCSAGRPGTGCQPRPELKPQRGPSPDLGDLAPTDPGKPAVTRGGPTWASPNGSTATTPTRPGSLRESSMSARTAAATVRAATTPCRHGRRSRLRAPAPRSIFCAANTRAVSSCRRRSAAPTTSRSCCTPSAMRTGRSASR